MNANPESPPKIDWMYYKKVVPVPGMVDNFQKQYESMIIPFPADTATSLISAQEQEVVCSFLFIDLKFCSFVFFL